MKIENYINSGKNRGGKDIKKMGKKQKNIKKMEKKEKLLKRWKKGKEIKEELNEKHVAFQGASSLTISLSGNFVGYTLH